MYECIQRVRVRKYDVNVEQLKRLLRKSKSNLGLSNVQIADLLQVSKTTVEHWFRIDDCFSIPDPNLWLNLKHLLDIKTGEFDDPIMTFVERDGVFEKSGRVYDEFGIAPTLTTALCEKVLIRI